MSGPLARLEDVPSRRLAAAFIAVGLERLHGASVVMTGTRPSVRYGSIHAPSDGDTPHGVLRHVAGWVLRRNLLRPGPELVADWNIIGDVPIRPTEGVGSTIAL